VRICVIGATGWLGGLVVGEALERGHALTAVVRDAGPALDDRVEVRLASITDGDALAAALPGHDSIVVAYRAPADDPDEMPRAARELTASARRAEVRRIVWIGGTGTLQVPGGGTDIVDLPEFPGEWKDATLAHREALNVFRREAGDLDWTYISVPRTIEPGERTGSYRVGGDELLVDERGESRISAEDLAVAVVDLLESGERSGSRITLAY
jgi:putative NADH-flavin reductase